MRRAYKIMVENAKDRKPIGMHRGEDNIKMDLKRAG
jgi:hypothetical protein